MVLIESFFELMDELEDVDHFKTVQKNSGTKSILAVNLQEGFTLDDYTHRPETMLCK